jgi:outer membrane protein
MRTSIMSHLFTRAGRSMSDNSCRRLAAIVLGLALLSAARAEDDCAGPSPDCVAVGRWNFSVALGAGARTNPLLNGKDLPLVVVPHVSYYGSRFFLDDLDLGFTVAEGRANAFNLVLSPSYDRVYFYRSDLQNIFVSGFGGSGTSAVVEPVPTGTPGAVPFPPRPRRVTYLGGPEWTFKYAGVTGQLDVLHEVTGQNGGNEVRAALGVPLIKARGSLTAHLGVTWKSAAIVDYFYGAPGIYDGKGSALNPFFKLAYTLPLAGRWRFNAFAQYDHLGSAIADSPIVAERYVATVFIGAIYSF